MNPHEGWLGFRWAFHSVSIRSAAVALLSSWIVLFEAPAETTSSLENAVLVLPFKAPESAKGTDDAYLGFAVANLFENMLAVHDGLAECWLNWHLPEIFSKADDFEAWFVSEKEVPPKVTELQLRYLLTGEIWVTGKDLAVHVVLLDQSDGKRWEEHLTIDLPGLQQVRAGLLHLLERAGINASPVQQSKLLWNEKLNRQCLVLLGQGVHSYEIAVNYDDKDAWFNSEYFERALELSPDSYLLLDNLGWVQFKRNNYSAATETFHRALQSNNAGSDAIDGIIACGEQERDDVLGATWTGRKAEAQHRDANALLATFWNRYGDKAYDREDFQVASEAYRKAVSLTPTKALYLTNLAFALAKLRDFVQAESYFKQVLEMRRNALDNENADTATAIANLAWLYQEMEQYANAEPLYLEALRIQKKVLGAEHPDVATSLHNLAGLYYEMGDYKQAEPLFLEALRIRKKVLGAEHLGVANSLNNLGELYYEMGDYKQAEPLFSEALRIRKKVLGAEHPDVANSLNNLGELYCQMHNYDKAEPLYLEALRIQKEVLGPEHLGVAKNLDSLAELYEYMGNYGQAQPLYLEALRIRKKVLGPEHRKVAASLNNLAGLYKHMGNYAQAEPLLLEALRIHRKVLGSQHPDTITSLENLAFLDLALGRPEDAGKLARMVSTDQLTLFAKILSFTSEQQRLAYQEANDFFSVLAATPNNDERLGLVAFRCKGVVLDSIIEDQNFYRASGRVMGGENLLEKLTQDRQEIGKLLLASSQTATQTQVKVEALEQEVQAMESKLAAVFTGGGERRRELGVTPDEIASVLPRDTILVDYLRYLTNVDSAHWRPAYGAIVLLPGGKPKFVALPSDSAESAIKRCRHLVGQHDVPDDIAMTKVLTQLYGDLWAPIQKLLPDGVKRVIISPDGELNFISFATLLDSDQHFLAEKFVLEYVTTGRDLLESIGLHDGRDCVLVGNPDFEGALLAAADRLEAGGVKMRGRETENMEDLQFASLTGTEAEVDEISKAIQAQRWNTTVLTGRAASKAALLALHHPYILHIATHGFFEPIDGGEPENEVKTPVQENRRKYFDNPMHRSGLALAGANLTVAAWRQKNTPETDGVLTAEDAGTLDLKGTWLVTLSACDTGEGETKSGEGVMGLRRGFLEAGAQNLLMTLWPVNDQATPDLMKDFYTAALENHNAPLALAEVQRNWLVRLRKEKGLAAAVQLAGPFILTFKGKP